MHRTHTCGELRKEHIWQTVILSGWIDDIRDMGGMVFLTLRDRYGVTQVNFDPQVHTVEAKPEYCVKVVGTVVARPSGQENKDMPTGDVEIELTSYEILTACKELPFPIRDEHGSSEEIRFKHRFLDLRRNPVLKNIEFRARMNHFTRNWFTHADFLEVQTPLFTVSSPEWARDYVIPSRVNPGKFYALPQAPQQYKQLLMVGWVDKYFQIAPCFRDEDPRADRHSCEFYQVDAEMSFVEQDDVFAIAEKYVSELVEELVPEKWISVDFAKIPYHEAMEAYGSDKPDLRFDMQFVDVTTILNNAGINFLAWKECIKCIKLDAEYTEWVSRKVVEWFEKVCKEAGAGWLPWIKWWTELSGSIGKLVNWEIKDELQELTDTDDGDILFFALWSSASVAKVLNKLRLHLRDTFDLANQDELAFCWITDFPFYEYDEGHDKWDFGHNPFSHVVGWVESLKNKDFADIETNQYDMVLNGYEILSGSIRNSNPDVMVAAFEKLWLSEDDVKERFGAMYEAFQYWAPPHGWFAFGFDRLMMILLDEPNIRECYAFPKSWRAEDVMMWAPSTIDQEQLVPGESWGGRCTRLNLLSLMKNTNYIITTPRLVLRCYALEDAILMKEAIDDSLEHLQAWMPRAKDEPETLAKKQERVLEYQQDFQKNKQYVYGIFSPDESLLIGSMGLHDRIWPDALEIGYRIRASHIGQWYATEAAKALIDVWFNHIGIDRIEIHTRLDNIRSARIPEKLWFEKMKKTVFKKDGEFYVWYLQKENYLEQLA